jgi:hypothetical protein
MRQRDAAGRDRVDKMQPDAMLCPEWSGLNRNAERKQRGNALRNTA